MCCVLTSSARVRDSVWHRRSKSGFESAFAKTSKTRSRLIVNTQRTLSPASSVTISRNARKLRFVLHPTLTPRAVVVQPPSFHTFVILTQCASVLRIHRNTGLRRQCPPLPHKIRTTCRRYRNRSQRRIRAGHGLLSPAHSPFVHSSAARRSTYPGIGHPQPQPPLPSTISRTRGRGSSTSS